MNFFLGKDGLELNCSILALKKRNLLYLGHVMRGDKYELLQPLKDQSKKIKRKIFLAKKLCASGSTHQSIPSLESNSFERRRHLKVSKIRPLKSYNDVKFFLNLCET